MPAFAVETFEQQAEAFVRARAWREWQFVAGLRPGRGLVQLYTDEFPSFTSTELYADLQEAQVEDASHKRWLSELLASAILEGRTLDLAARAAGFEARTSLTFEGEEVTWREAPARWALIPEVARRHALEDTWRSALRTELNPSLGRWHEQLRAQLAPLGATDWVSFWDAQRGLGLDQLNRAAETLLSASAAVYEHTLGVYLGQLELPIDDVWRPDMDWAWRAARFDTVFTERSRLPIVLGSLRELGIHPEQQAALHLEAGPTPGVQWLPVAVPDDVRVLLRLVGGWQDYLRTFRGLGAAQALAQVDRSAPFVHRWLGDPTVTLASGLLFERVVRDRMWLAARLDYEASDDYRIISHIAWLQRLRRQATLLDYQQRVWRSEPGGSLAADYADALSAALRVRHFGDTYLMSLIGGPWATLRSAVRLRAELFAAQLRAYLRREFDDEWWRRPRAGRFLVDELWRPGRRYTAEELLGFMGYEGFDPAILWAEVAEVLGTV